MSIKRYSLINGECANGFWASYDECAKEIEALKAENESLRKEISKKDAAIEDLLQSNADMVTCFSVEYRHQPYCLLLDPEEPECYCTCDVSRQHNRSPENPS